MITLKSESANKTQQNNAKILFGSKGIGILSKLEEYNKEKVVNTDGIAALLEVLKTKDTALLEKFASSKTGKTLVSNCKKLASAKTFSAIMKNIKAIKPLKSFDKFIAPAQTETTDVKPNVRVDKPTADPLKFGIPDETDIFRDVMDLSPKAASPSVGKYLGKILEIPTKLVKTGSIEDKPKFSGYSIILRSGAEVVFAESKESPIVRKRLGVRKRYFFYVDDRSTGGPANGEPSPISGTMLEAPNFEALLRAVQGRNFTWANFSGATGAGQSATFGTSRIQELAKTDAGRKEIADRISKLHKHSGLDFVVTTSFGRTKGYFLQARGATELKEVHSVILGGLKGINRTWNPTTRFTKTIHQRGRFKEASEYTSLKAAVNAMVIATKKMVRKNK